MEVIEIYKQLKFSDVLDGLTLLIFAWAINRLLSFFSQRISSGLSAQRLRVQQFVALLRFFVYVFFAFWAVRATFSVSDEVLTVVGGTVAVSVGIALKDQAASLVAGIIILMEKPFQVGDRISFGGYYGEVHRIGLRSITLVTLDDNNVTIPNSKVLTEAVASSNAGALTMLVQQDFFIGADQDVSEAKRLVEEAMTSSCFFRSDKPWSVQVRQERFQTTVGVRLRAKAYVLELGYEKRFESDVAHRVIEGFQRAKIAPPAAMVRAAEPEPELESAVFG